MGLLSTLFGGSKQKSTSDNQAYGTLSGLLSGNVGQGNTAMGVLGSLLGIGDPAAGAGATKNFLEGSGFQTILDAGTKAITGSGAAGGLLRSGGTGKALVNFGQDAARTKIGELMQGLTSLGNYGMQSAGTIAGAGQRSTSSGSSSSGIFNSLFPGGLSDIRTKNLLATIGERSDGITVYRFEYKTHPGKEYIGVVAQEVEAIRPNCLGPVVDGFLTVDYDKLGVTEGFPAFGAVELEAA